LFFSAIPRFPKNPLSTLVARVPNLTPLFAFLKNFSIMLNVLSTQVVGVLKPMINRVLTITTYASLNVVIQKFLKNI
jgi:hypothetical protein